MFIFIKSNISECQFHLGLATILSESILAEFNLNSLAIKSYRQC